MPVLDYELKAMSESGLAQELVLAQKLARGLAHAREQGLERPLGRRW